MKVVFDQNVPIGLVKVLQAFAKEHQFRKISGNFEIKAAADYTPQRGDPDYRPNNDVPWLKRFADDGGKVVISGDTKMKNRAHERLALIEGGFVVIFFEPAWSNWKFLAQMRFSHSLVAGDRRQDQASQEGFVLSCAMQLDRRRQTSMGVQ